MRAFDVAVAGVGLVLLSPLLTLVALAIRIDSAGPVLFGQERVGLNGRRFRILKFRTMAVDAERQGGQLTQRGDPRVTRVGRVLRASKVDELAQLFNVLAGDMALVGPRPEVPRYVALYDAAQCEVLKVRPGITDPASIIYRNESDVLAAAPDPERFYVEEVFPRKLALSRVYVQRRSFWLDLGVLARTAQCLLFPAAAARAMLRSLGMAEDGAGLPAGNATSAVGVGARPGQVPVAGRGGAAAPALDVLLISQHNYPSNASGGRLLTQLCTDLAARGARVSAISSALHYTTDHGVRLAPREEHGGVVIERYAPTRFDRRSMAGRSINELAYSLRVGLRVLGRARPDVILALSSPPFMLPVVALVARLRGIPLVPVVMDVFPDMATVTGHLQRSSLVYRVWDAAQRAALRSSARIVVLGRCMRDVVRGKCGGVAIDVVPNWADDELHPLVGVDNRFLAAYPQLREPVVVMYSGNLGHFHDFETLLGAAERLRARDDVRFAVIGDGAKRGWLEQQVAARRLPNVDLLPFQPPDMLPHSLNAADIALVTLEPGAEGLCVPSKFYPLLAVGRPIVAVMARHAEVALVVDASGCGVVVAPGDAAALARAVAMLADAPAEREAAGARGRAAFLAHFARRYAADRYLDVLLRATGRTPPAREPTELAGAVP